MAKADKTWANTKVYSASLWKMTSRHTKVTAARRGRFEGCSSIRKGANSVNGQSTTSNGTFYTSDTGPPSHIMTKDDQSSMVKYCNILEGALVEAKETVANILTSNDKLMERIDSLNKEWMQKMSDQQDKFMKMMMSSNSGEERPLWGVLRWVKQSIQKRPLRVQELQEKSVA